MLQKIKNKQASPRLTASGMTEIETGKSERKNHRVGQMNLKNKKNGSFQFPKIQINFGIMSMTILKWTLKGRNSTLSGHKYGIHGGLFISINKRTEK